MPPCATVTKPQGLQCERPEIFPNVFHVVLSSLGEGRHVLATFAALITLKRWK